MTNIEGDSSASIQAAGLPETPYTDAANAHRFATEHHHQLRYAPELGQWYVWDGTRWAPDTLNVHMECAKLTADRIGEYVNAASSSAAKPMREALRRWARGVAMRNGLNSMVALAQSDPRIVVAVERFDADPFVLNTPGGVIDLNTGTSRAHDPADLITRTTAAMITSRPPSQWLAFLERVQPEAEVRAYLQRLMGLALLGVVREHLLPIFYGSGANGKSTFLETIRRLLGDYAGQASTDLLMAGRQDTGAATPHLMELRGRRLMVASESSQDGKLAAERVKAITGGDAINARPLYGNPVTFQPSHLAVLMTNYKPRVVDESEAIWRRLALVPWPVQIPPDEWDHDLQDRLVMLDGPGILGWLVDGCLAYLDRGLDTPATVRAATIEYRSAEDAFGAFLDERCVVGRGLQIAAGDLHAAYRDWADTCGADRLASAALAERLEQRGFRRGPRTKQGRHWAGLRLLNPGEERPEAGVAGVAGVVPPRFYADTRAPAGGEDFPENGAPATPTTPSLDDELELPDLQLTADDGYAVSADLDWTDGGEAVPP